ncbi:MAG: tetraacyldisaccharide 4'-kinase [Gammaproteobacteria bacterium]
MEGILQALWYGERYKAWPLLPLSGLFQCVTAVRRSCYRNGLLRVHRLPVPVVIVGNISVGGTGKTPLLIYLARLLVREGLRPGIVSRGYRGRAEHWPQRVEKDSDPLLVGDEAVLIAAQTVCPMAVGPLRIEAARLLLENAACDVILSDDGLQHYALGRTLEIAVVDGERRFGNGYCLPAGPLREPVSRLRDVDITVCNGAAQSAHEYSMQVVGDEAVNLLSGEHRPLSFFAGRNCHAVAGIGNPQRFFGLLQHAGIVCTAHVFPDHYAYRAADIDFPDDKPVLMTEKDAVKCRGFAHANDWYVPVRAVLQTGFNERFLHLFREKSRG